MRALFDDIKDRYQLALSELPDMSSHFVATDSRKPAISKFGDMYHVTVGHSRAKSPSHRSHRFSSASNAGTARPIGIATDDGAL
jgi:hypothetical protein